jgi:ABC-type phosphate/phosphonate transport system substrate-binding protein
MRSESLHRIVISVCLLTVFGVRSDAVCGADPVTQSQLTLIVMDPMAAPLACDCVKGYAQRKYESLGAYLQKKLHRSVQVVWDESLNSALEKSGGTFDLIIGKHSVVVSDAHKKKHPVRPLARLTDVNDGVDQTGLIVVRQNDSAKRVEDLKGYRILFGPAECDEKSSAVMELLKGHHVPIPDPVEIAPSCSNAAITLMELPADAKAAAVISSYAEPLLEGCGKVAKGDLRVIGRSNAVPFITMFVRESLPAENVSEILQALEDVSLEAQLLIDMETASGFIPWDDAPAESAARDAKKKS